MLIVNKKGTNNHELNELKLFKLKVGVPPLNSVGGAPNNVGQH